MHDSATVVTEVGELPTDCAVVIATSHRLGAMGERKRISDHLGPARNGDAPFDVLFVDEAWQLPHHLFDRVAESRADHGRRRRRRPAAATRDRHEPVARRPGLQPLPGVADRLLRRRAHLRDELPAVWRPTAEQLPLWRAFYPEWASSTASPPPATARSSSASSTGSPRTSGRRWAPACRRCSRSTGWPTPEAADVDLPLVEFAERLLDELFAAGFALVRARTTTTRARRPARSTRFGPGDDPDDPLVAVLATRNQAVDDATDAVERLREAARPDREGPRRLDRRLVAGPDQRDHGRDPPADRRRAARRVQLRSSAASPSPARAPPTGC